MAQKKVKNPRSMGRILGKVNEENIKPVQICGGDLKGRRHLRVLGAFQIRIWKRFYLATAQEDPVQRSWQSQSTAGVLHSSNNLWSQPTVWTDTSLRTSQMVAELAVNNLVQVHKPSEVHESILPFVLSDEWQHPGIRPQVSGPVQDKEAAHSFLQAPF